MLILAFALQCFSRATVEVTDDRTAVLRLDGENADIDACAALLQRPVQFWLTFETGETNHIFKFYEEQKTVMGVFYEGVWLTAANYAGPQTVQRFVADVQN